MATVLYTSGEVRNAIIDLFSRSKGRRVAIVAFVANGAEKFLPKPKGIELICWPKAGGTNPDVLRRLSKKHVVIQFADSLHMKVYWTEDLGAVVTSANLSTNALGTGGLMEFGVKLGRGQIDIMKLLASIKSRPMADEELHRLDRLHDLLMSHRISGKQTSSVESFRSWLRSPARRRWKLMSWEEDVDFSETAKAEAKILYGVASPVQHLICSRGILSKGDWVLIYRTVKSTITEVDWMFVHHIVQLPRADPLYDKLLNEEALQIYQKRHPPFRVDKHFKSGFREAVEEYGIEALDDLAAAYPPKKLIDYMTTFCK